MSMMTLVIPGSTNAFADLGVGFFGELDLPLNPTAVYLPGSAFGATVRDQTGNGHDAIAIGAPTRSALYSTLSTPSCFEIPVTGNALLAEGDGSGVTLLGVGRAASDKNGFLISNYYDAAQPGIGVVLGNTSLVRTFCWGPSSFASIATDATRGSRWGFYGGVMKDTSVQAFERHDGSAQVASAITTFASRPFAGLQKLRLGGAVVASSVADPVDVAAIAIYNRALSAGEIDTVYAAMSAFLAPKGITV